MGKKLSAKDGSLYEKIFHTSDSIDKKFFFKNREQNTLKQG